MTDKELIAIICSGWLSNKWASFTEPKDTAKRAYEIAKEIVKLMNEGGE